MDLEQLKQEIPFKWRVQSVNQYGASCVAYVDARDVQDLLDKVVGAGYWQVKYKEHKGNLFASIGINITKGEGVDVLPLWVWKSDCGTESNVEKQKGEASDAFKRAAVAWGIGRFLYRLKILKIKEVAQDKQNRWYPISNGSKIWDINKHCNALHLGANPKPKPKQDSDRNPALTIEQFESAKKGTEAQIKTVLSKFRMSAEQRAELTVLTKF